MPVEAYGLRRRTSLSFEQADARVRELLKEQGFGVLTEIDVKATLKQKLDKEFRRYVILGACNPPLAYQALSAETDIGLLLPCNVIVYEDGDGAVVAALDPLRMMELTGNPALTDVASEARRKLEAVLDALPA
ncbi:MAG TPA: DUF302 domain-containing protein [Candidatus Limnocylindrales bacterium]|nr:DUF302 domain-containing protein [Candidatus Limnocylindrales bacterium]